MLDKNISDRKDHNSIYFNCPYCKMQRPVVFDGFVKWSNECEGRCEYCKKIYTFSFQVASYHIATKEDSDNFSS